MPPLPTVASPCGTTEKRFSGRLWLWLPRRCQYTHVRLQILKYSSRLPADHNLVVGACRDPEKAKALANLRYTSKSTLHAIPFDIVDIDSVLASATVLKGIFEHTRLDHLINNAAVVCLAP